MAEACITHIYQTDSPHPQFGSLPVNHPLMMAAAHPTPARTERAPAGQLSAHAPHSMQASRSAISAFPLSTVNTARGQTTWQIAAPIALLGLQLKRHYVGKIS